jgi:predicted amidohydrolase YtcJ
MYNLSRSRTNPIFTKIVSAILFSSALMAADPDLILYNGKIVTVDPRFSIAQAVAVSGERVLAVGADEAIVTMRAASTKIIDLHGRTVLPGLIDSHVHALEAALSEFRAPLPALDSYAAVQRFLREKARTTPKGEWIVVPRTFPTRLEELRMPTKDVLDVITDHPVVFDASYVVILNSAALQKCGIDRNTPNPPGGEIGKDANGEPNGILKNGQALLKGISLSGHFTDEEKLRALEDQLKRYVAAGLTGIGDRAVNPEQIAVYETLHDSGRLPLRVSMTWRPDASRPTEELIQAIETAPYTRGSGDDWLRFSAFKLTLDGGMTIGTAYQRQPYGAFGKQLYAKTDPDDRGQLFVAPAKLLAVMRAARKRGWQLTTHDQGGGAIDAWLDTLEALDREKPIAPTRSFVMHASFQSPQAIARMKKMGIAADTQSQWLYLDGAALEKVFGNDGMRWFFPLRSYLDAGIKVAAGSDHMIGHDKNRAVNPYNPFVSMWTEVSRKMTNGRVLHAEQKITREEALKTHTIWAAWLQFAEDKRGSIEPGKFADFVVIDHDYLTCPEDEIRRIEPGMVIIDGKIAWERK